jgi:hypothetical protein
MRRYACTLTTVTTAMAKDRAAIVAQLRMAHAGLSEEWLGYEVSVPATSST